MKGKYNKRDWEKEKNKQLKKTNNQEYLEQKEFGKYIKEII